MTEERQPAPQALNIRFSVQWQWVLGLMGALAITLIGMWFTLAKLSSEVSEMKISINSGNTQVTTLAGEQALLRFRLENVEGEIRAIKGLPVSPRKEQAR